MLHLLPADGLPLNGGDFCSKDLVPAGFSHVYKSAGARCEAHLGLCDRLSHARSTLDAAASMSKLIEDLLGSARRCADRLNPPVHVSAVVDGVVGPHAADTVLLLMGVCAGARMGALRHPVGHAKISMWPICLFMAVNPGYVRQGGWESKAETGAAGSAVGRVGVLPPLAGYSHRSYLGCC